MRRAQPRENAGQFGNPAMNAYIDERRKAGRRPFIDGPHFELP